MLPRLRSDFGEYLNALGLRGYAIEIGVHRGEFAKELLDTWRGERLYLVDPWRELNRDEYDDPINTPNREEDLRACLALLRPHIDRYVIIMARSLEIAPIVADETVDLIYIDGNHAEEYVSADLTAWWPKLKPGGIFAGHDYLSATWPGVARAVQAFSAQINRTINITTETGGSWWFQK